MSDARAELASRRKRDAVGPRYRHRVVGGKRCRVVSQCVEAEQRVGLCIYIYLYMSISIYLSIYLSIYIYIYIYKRVGLTHDNTYMH